MKKNNYFVSNVLLALIFFIPVVSLHAADPGISVQRTHDSLRIEYQIPDLPASRLFTSLAAGQIAEIEYEFRLFQETRGILSLLGDKLLGEKSQVYSIRYDELNPGYIRSSAGTEEVYPDFVHLNAALSRVSADFDISSSGDHEEMYMRVRTTIIPNKLVAPFSLLQPFLPKNRIQYGWTEYRITEILRSN